MKKKVEEPKIDIGALLQQQADDQRAMVEDPEIKRQEMMHKFYEAKKVESDIF